MDKEFIVIGTVIKSQGNKGEVQVAPHTDDPARFDRLQQVYLLQKDRSPRLCRLERVRRRHNGRLILKLSGCDSIGEAGELARADLAVEERDMISLPAGTYFYFQIIGLQTYTKEGRYLGKVAEIFPAGNNDVYVVRDEKEETLIPAVKEIVKEVDLEGKKLTVDLPEGL